MWLRRCACDVRILYVYIWLELARENFFFFVFLLIVKVCEILMTDGCYRGVCMIQWRVCMFAMLLGILFGRKWISSIICIFEKKICFFVIFVYISSFEFANYMHSIFFLSTNQHGYQKRKQTHTNKAARLYIILYIEDSRQNLMVTQNVVISYSKKKIIIIINPIS